MRNFKFKGAVALIVAGFLALAPITAANADAGPPAVTGATLTAVNNTAEAGYDLTLTWDATGAYGGFMQPDYYAYDINKNGVYDSGSITNNTTVSYFVPYGDGDTYEFTVTASYDGDSAEVTYSNTIDASAPAPYQMPFITGVNVTNVNSIDGSFDVSWDVPTDTGNSPLNGFVAVLYVGGLPAGEVQVDADVYTAHFTGVVAGEYDVMVHGVTDFGDGEESSPLTVTIDQLYGASALNNVVIDRSQTLNGYDISWAAPDEDGGAAIEYYKVEIKDNSALNPNDTVFADIIDVTEPLETVASGAGLVVGHYYTVSLWAVNAAALDGAVSSYTVYLGQMEPTNPRNVTITQFDSTHVLVQWDAPVYDGGAAVLTYGVSVTKTPFWIETAYEQTTSTSVIVEVGNHPGNSYNVNIQADGGDGWVSSTANAATPALWAATAPSDPAVYAYADGNHDPKVSVTYSADDNGSAITGWILTLKKVGSSAVVESYEAGANENSHEFDTILENDADYRVTVAAFNAIGDSATTEEVTTASYNPAAPDESDFASAPQYVVTVTGDVGTITVTDNSVSAGDYVYGFAFSTPVSLGWTQLNASKVATFNLAGLNLPNGTHTLAVLNSSGTLLGSGTFVVNKAVVVTPVTSNPAVDSILAATGSNPTNLAVFAMLLLLAGITVVGADKRRKVGNLS